MFYVYTLCQVIFLNKGLITGKKRFGKILFKKETGKLTRTLKSDLSEQGVKFEAQK